MEIFSVKQKCLCQTIMVGKDDVLLYLEGEMDRIHNKDRVS